MGAVIATSQLFFMMFLVYFGHGYDRHMQGLNVREERMLSILSILQCVFLASFAAILGSHRSEILDRSNAPQAIGVTNMVMTRTTTNGTTSKKMPNPQYNSEESNLESKGSYVPPNFIDD